MKGLRPEKTIETRVVKTSSPEETRAVGRRVGQMLQVGDCVALVGRLGSGKTCFVSGLAEGMKVQGRVASPSFIIMRAHPGPVHLFHADAYRINAPEELEEAGLFDWLQDGAVVIEWADRVAELLPPDALIVEFEYTDTGREITFHATTDRQAKMLKELP
ncbi:MAG: tRNA (adenosine(37)-N6)-threonylcarbamoyltransferase complex ATPase subunit type 1 TsaE [Armatimonadota bacterium]